MADALDNAILSKRQLYKRLKSELDRAGIELRALEFAASLRPTQPIPKEDEEPSDVGEHPSPNAIPLEDPRRGGKPAGAISPRWRQVLELQYGEPPVPYNGFLATATALDIVTNPMAIRDRVRAWYRMGFLEGNPRDGFSVTEEAAKRFGFTKSPSQQSVVEPPDDDLKSQKAPQADAQEAFL